MSIRSANVEVAVPVSSIGSAAGLPDLRVEGEAGALQVFSRVLVDGTSYPVSAPLTTEIVDDRMLVMSTGAPAGVDAELPAGAGPQQLFTLEIPLKDLPVGLRDATVDADGDSLVVRAQTQDLDFVS